MSQFIPIIPVRILFSVAGVVFILATMRTLIGTRIVIDKLTQSVTVSKRSFFLASRQRVIPFSDVKSVVIAYEKKHNGGGGPFGGGGGSYDEWMVYLGTRGEIVKIDHTTKRSNMLNLARGISDFMGKEMVDYSAKPESFFKRIFRKDER